jgi:perosamine synthetase
MIPYGRQTIEEDDIQAVVEVLKSDYLTTGPKVEEFEGAFAEYVGAKYAVSFSNGTAALHGATSWIDPNSYRYEVITTPMTFAATANSILYADFVPVFADVDEDTLLLDPESVEASITDKTIGIIAVDYAGQPCDYNALGKIANKYDLVLIADACHSLGATYRGVRVGTLADMTIFSFHPVKLITTGEGGMITTNDEKTAEFLREFRNHGRSGGVMGHLGYNYRLTDIQCALGISQLSKIDRFLHCRKDVAGIYDSAFSRTDKVTPLSVKENIRHAYHLYVVKLDNREEAIKLLNNAGVTTTIHYPPVYSYSKVYQQYYNGECPVTEKVSGQILSLPIYPHLYLNDQAVVINALMQL